MLPVRVVICSLQNLPQGFQWCHRRYLHWIVWHIAKSRLIFISTRNWQWRIHVRGNGVSGMEKYLLNFATIFAIFGNYKSPDVFCFILFYFASVLYVWCWTHLLLKTFFSVCNFLGRNDSVFWNTWKCSNFREPLFKHYYFCCVLQ
jgi:hypothetical protein